MFEFAKTNAAKAPKVIDSKKKSSLDDDLLREVRARSTDPALSHPKFRVDPFCDIKNVKVLGDYSVSLTLADVDFGDATQGKFYKMQVLERKDGLKWFVWFQYGKRSQENPTVKVSEFFARAEAMALFERRFEEKTKNKWTMKELF